MFFKNELKKRIKNEKGLTLIELLAVIVILAIIAAIAIPAIGNIINNSRDKATLSDMQSAISAAKIAKADGSCAAPAADKSVTCDGTQFEFKSDKIVNKTGGETISVVFADTGLITVTTTLEKPFSGTRIPDAVKAAGTTDNPAGTIAEKVLTITDTRLNAVLGGN